MPCLLFENQVLSCNRCLNSQAYFNDAMDSNLGNSESCLAISNSFSNEVTLSEADRKSYERIFSSVLVLYASLTMEEAIGQGECLLSVN